MIYSMTGFGRISSEKGNWLIEAEIKSVNSRFLEVYLRLPSSLYSKEYELREIIRGKLKRGKINLNLQMKRNGRLDDSVLLDEVKLKNYVSFVKQVKKVSGLKDKIKLEHLLASKEVYTSNLFELTDEEFKSVKKIILSAVDELLKMKKREGDELAKDLKKRLKNIEKKLDQIEEETSSSLGENFEKYKERINSLIEDSSAFNDRLEMELAILSERADITEECVRLRSHLKLFSESVTKEDEPGRKLNFICQEMNRETNTISSKTLSTKITHLAVSIKEEIERIREQIQNIE